jgi:S1-C subfamily serine protease
MSKIFLIVVFLIPVVQSFSQVRYGWRSVYDNMGRLSRANYFENGINSIDSNYYFQYYVDNVVKGIINGEMTREQGCKNGSIFLFDESSNLTSLNIKRSGETVFSTTCEYGENCMSVWGDKFESATNCWEGDSIEIENGELVIHNSKAMAVSIFNPPVPVNLGNEFILQTTIPKEKNSSRLGVVLGWKDAQNYFLVEVLFGENISVLNCVDGVVTQIGDLRIPIEQSQKSLNEVVIRRKAHNLIIEVNKNIESIVPVPSFVGDKVGLITRSRGSAHFGEFLVQYMPPLGDAFYSEYWVGKGTGFFISSSGKILTTFDVIADAKNIRVKGTRNGKSFVLPARVQRLEEDQNLAVLQITDEAFVAFDDIPFGYSSSKPVSESTVFSIGFPNAVSGIIVNPEVFSGKILPSSASSSTQMLLEMSFRFGMIGSPVFDLNANLVGVVANKGLEMKYTEVIDFYSNARLLQGHMGKFERSVESPLKQTDQKTMIKALSELVVIIESSVFNLQE